MKKMRFIELILLLILILVIPATAQPDCSVLTGTGGCGNNAFILVWTAQAGANGYKLCFDEQMTDCYDVGNKPSVYPNLHSGSWVFHIIPYDNNMISICVSNKVPVTFPLECDVPTPEFPTSLLPATLIIGILGTVFYIQRTREH